MSPGTVNIPARPSAASSRAAAATAPVCPLRAPASTSRVPYLAARRLASGSTVTTRIPGMPGVAVSADRTSSSIANANACRICGGRTGAKRSFARPRSLTGTTAQRSISKAAAHHFEYRSRQRLAIPERQHQSRRANHGDAGITYGPGIALIRDVKVEDVAVMPGHRRRVYGQAEFLHHLGGRPLDRFAANDRRNRNNRRPAAAQRLANPGHGEDRVDADKWVRRADDHCPKVLVSERPQKLRLRPRL